MRKRILILTPIFPLPLKSGGQVRVFNMIKHLSETCDVSLLSLLDKREQEYGSRMKEFCKEVRPIVVDVHDSPVSKLMSFVRPDQISRTFKRLAQWAGGSPMQICRFYHKAFEDTLRRMIAQDSYDVVHAVYAQMAPYLTLASELDTDVKTVLVDIDLSFLPFQRESSTRSGLARWISRMESDKLLNYVSRTWPRFDRIVVMSDSDGDKLLETAPASKIAVSPNGVDVDSFRPQERTDVDPYGLVFLGGSRHRPNVDAVNYFLSDIFPRVRARIPEATLRIVGEFDPALLPEDREGVELTGFVEDVRPHVLDRSLFVVPLRIGGGTRLKILEAMALGVPVVSTSVGYEGIEAVPGRDILIEDDPEAFAQRIVETLRNDALKQKLSANGRRVIEDKYDWRAIARGMGSIYDELLGKRTHPVHTGPLVAPDRLSV